MVVGVYEKVLDCELVYEKFNGCVVVVVFMFVGGGIVVEVGSVFCGGLVVLVLVGEGGGMFDGFKDVIFGIMGLCGGCYFGLVEVVVKFVVCSIGLVVGCELICGVFGLLFGGLSNGW